jgi:hypothetical protein
MLGREEGIRTLDTLPYTHFPGVLLQPLGHLSKIVYIHECITSDKQLVNRARSVLVMTGKPVTSSRLPSVVLRCFAPCQPLGHLSKN